MAKRRRCPQCGFWKEIQRDMTFCEDCRKNFKKEDEKSAQQKLRKDETLKEEIFKETSEEKIEIPIIGEILPDKKLGNKIRYFKGRP